MDVLEHIDDDAAAARQMRRFLRAGGFLFVRYTAESLGKVLETAGFVDVKILWWGQLMYHLIRHQRSGKKGLDGESPDQVYLRYLRLPGYPLRWGMDVAFWADRLLTRAGLSSIGTSLLAIARRPN